MSLRLIATCLVFLVTLELLARFDDTLSWGAPFWGLSWKGDLLRNDENGTRGKPHARYQKWKLNSWGFRGPEIAKTKPDRVIRVIIAGASEVFGLYESEGMEFPRQTQRLLDEKHPGRFEVINAAGAGMSPPMVTHNFKVWLSQFRPDLLIFYPSPQFYLNNTPPHLVLSSLDTNPSPYTLRIVQKSKTLVRESLPLWLRAKIWRGKIEEQSSGRAKEWFWPKVPTERLDLFGTHLTQLVETVQKAGVRVMLASHANRFGATLSELDRQLLISYRTFYPRATPSAILGLNKAANERIRRVAEQMKTAFVDVHRKIGKQPQLFADFSHFSDRGSTKAAAIFSQAILDEFRTQSPRQIDSDTSRSHHPAAAIVEN